MNERHLTSKQTGREHAQLLRREGSRQPIELNGELRVQGPFLADALEYIETSERYSLVGILSARKKVQKNDGSGHSIDNGLVVVAAKQPDLSRLHDSDYMSFELLMPLVKKLSDMGSQGGRGWVYFGVDEVDEIDYQEQWKGFRLFEKHGEVKTTGEVTYGHGNLSPEVATVLGNTAKVSFETRVVSHTSFILLPHARFAKDLVRKK